MNPSQKELERRRSAYRSYLEFVQSVHQKDRLDVNRRMRSVFLWCFLAPVVTVALVIVLVNYRVLPRVFRSYQDWILLIFPVLYSLYFLGSQVLSGIPEAFRRGGFGVTLGQGFLLARPAGADAWRAPVIELTPAHTATGRRRRATLRTADDGGTIASAAG